MSFPELLNKRAFDKILYKACDMDNVNLLSRTLDYDLSFL